MNRVPNAGDIVWVDLDPVIGTEQAGRRPAVVVSSALFHGVSRRAVICPVTSNMQPWPTKVALPDSCKTRGMVLVDQIRAIDRQARPFHHIESCPADFLNLVREHIGNLLEIPSY